MVILEFYKAVLTSIKDNKVNAVYFLKCLHDFLAACPLLIGDAQLFFGSRNMLLGFQPDNFFLQEIKFQVNVSLGVGGGGMLKEFQLSGIKKSRPGILLRVICSEQDKEKMISLIFRHTTTLGIRETVSHRYTLEREIKTLESEDVVVREKTAAVYRATR